LILKTLKSILKMELLSGWVLTRTGAPDTHTNRR